MRILTPVLAVLLIGLVFTPFDPAAQRFSETALGGFGVRHPFGIDGLGRDFFSRVWNGAAHTIVMAGTATALTFALSTVLLAVEVAGPRWLRGLPSKVAAIGVAVPVVFVGLVLLVFLNPAPGTLVLAAAVGNTPLCFRQVRVFWANQVAAPYFEASQTLGAGPLHLARVTLWPNLFPDLAALARIVFALAALELSGLAYIGLVGDPDFAELGAIIRQNQSYLLNAPWLVLIPSGILTAILVLVRFSGRQTD